MGKGDEDSKSRDDLEIVPKWLIEVFIRSAFRSRLLRDHRPLSIMPGFVLVHVSQPRLLGLCCFYCVYVLPSIILRLKLRLAYNI